MNENERDLQNWWKHLASIWFLNLPNNFCQIFFFFLFTFPTNISSSQSSWKTFWFILLFPWNYEKRIISVQTPFKVLQCNYFLKSFSLQSLFHGRELWFLWGRKWKKFLCTVTANTIITIIAAVLIILNYVIYDMFDFQNCVFNDNHKPWE